MALLWKTASCGIALAAGIVGVHARAGRDPAGPAPDAVVASATPAPLLSSAPRRVVIEGEHAKRVTITGRRFEPDLTLTASSLFYTATFDRHSIVAETPTSLQFDAASLPDGVYRVVVRSPSGPDSNALTMTVERR